MSNTESRWPKAANIPTNPDGSPIFPDKLTQNFACTIKAIRLPPLTFHSLLHSFAPVALKAGMTPEVVREALGHHSINITLDTYFHVLPNMQDDLAIAVENILKRS